MTQTQQAKRGLGVAWQPPFVAPKVAVGEWLEYWKRAGMFNPATVHSIEDVKEARRFCSFLRVGVFFGVSDEAIYAAIRQSRGAVR